MEGDDEAVADGVHEVDALGEMVRGLLGGGCAAVPETDCAIPGTTEPVMMVFEKRRRMRQEVGVGRDRRPGQTGFARIADA
jgi:hypothetical protein